MTFGIKKFSDSSIKYDQERNGVEAIIKKVNAANKVNVGYLESCGICAFCTLMEGMEYLSSKLYLTFPTGKKIQFDDAVMVYANDPANGFDNSKMANRVAISYPKLANELFGARAEIVWSIDKNQLVSHLKSSDGIQICLKNPGHWIAVVAYDEDKDEFIYMDSWGSRPGLKNGGVHEVMSAKDLSNVQPFYIWYKAK